MFCLAKEDYKQTIVFESLKFLYLVLAYLLWQLLEQLSKFYEFTQSI